MYFPATHAVHVPPRRPVKPILQAQLVNTVEPTSLCALSGQLKHVLDEFAAKVSEYVLTSQSIHEELPVTVLYLPAIHAEHVPPSAPVNPALQTQLVERTLALGDCESVGQARHVLAVVAATVSEYVFAGHAVHPSEPAASLYLPSTHAVHIPPSGPVNPALHRQLLESALPLGDCELLGQSTQVASSEAPVVSE